MRAGVSSIFVLALLVGFVIAVPSASLGRTTTWKVTAGGYIEGQALQTQRFLPTSITINQGDSVTWTLGGNAHTIFFPADEKPPEIFVPGKGKGEVDFNPRVWFASGKSYNGSGPFSAGVLEEDFRTSYTVTFTKAGTYLYLCMFHPGMAAQVVVQPAGTPYPKTQAQYDQIGKQEAHESFAAARVKRDETRAAAAKNPNGKTTYTLSLVGSLPGKFTVPRFIPQVLRIKAGDTVTWEMQDPTEIHTVTFTSGRKTPIFDIFRPHEQPTAVVANPLALAPTGGAEYDGRSYYNSGLMEIITPHGVRSYSLTFTTPGQYNYTCIVHDPVGMRGTIVVTK